MLVFSKVEFLLNTTERTLIFSCKRESLHMMLDLLRDFLKVRKMKAKKLGKLIAQRPN